MQQCFSNQCFRVFIIVMMAVALLLDAHGQFCNYFNFLLFCALLLGFRSFLHRLTSLFPFMNILYKIEDLMYKFGLYWVFKPIKHSTFMVLSDTIGKPCKSMSTIFLYIFFIWNFETYKSF